jgi:hypothetical protein
VKVSPLELRREDIHDLSKGEQIERLFRALNTFGSSAGSALTSGLTFSDNLAAFVKEIDFTMGSEGETLSMTSPWTAQDTTCVVWKADTGVVQLEGRAARNTAAAGSTITTLAREYWPHRTLYFVGDTSAFQPCSVTVTAAGVVSATWPAAAPTWVSLDSVMYNAVDHRAKANPGFPVVFRNELSTRKPLGVWVWQAWDMNDRRMVPATGGAVAWEVSSNGDQIVVRDIANLPHERKYRVRLVVVAG